jgi:ribosomal protein S12 methylthiotransferase
LKRKINIVTLGCSKNLVDSEKLLKQLEAGGYSVVHNSEDLRNDTVIINTCGFVNDAREESIDTILSFVKAREKGLINNLFVMGCLAERYREALAEEIQEVDKYFGVNDMKDIAESLGVNLSENLLNDRSLTGPGHYAYLKVSEGCDRTCSFCAIPGIRGRYISRRMEEITAEARLLASKGVKELILIAQDLSYYGLDLYRKQMLPDLLIKLLQIKDFEWIRLHYLYPANFPFSLLGIMKENPRICRYFDIPIQHISDSVLSDMRRSHGKKETLNVLNTIRKELPDAAIRTTLIAGYPTETEKEFQELISFVKTFEFNRLGVFSYSHEEGTPAFNNHHDSVPEEIKTERMASIMECQQHISARLNRKYVGQSIKVLIDRTEGEFYIGRTEYDSPEVDQEVLIPLAYNLQPGLFYDILITDSSEFDLTGKPA